MTEPVDATRLAEFLDAQLGDGLPLTVDPMTGGGSCEITFATVRVSSPAANGFSPARSS